MFTTTPTVLVTGGAGYVGSHVVLALKSRGYRVIVFDNLTYGHRSRVETVLETELVVGDIGDFYQLSQVFSTYGIDAVIHLAAHAYSGESILEPAKYYRNNVTGTLTLLEAMISAGLNKLVFSSSASVYGLANDLPIIEGHPQRPISPYGAGKLAVERMLADFDKAYSLQSVVLRNFNAAGADPQAQLGEGHSAQTHLIPRILLTALGQQSAVSLYGTDYDTPDGTCIRDYVHVSDLANAHLLGLEYLLNGGTSQTFNLSSGNGCSVREVIDTARQITGRSIPVMTCDRRRGDPPILVGNTDKASRVLRWRPQYPTLKQMVHHAWRWHQRRHTISQPSVATTNEMMV